MVINVDDGDPGQPVRIVHLAQTVQGATIQADQHGPLTEGTLPPIQGTDNSFPTRQVTKIFRHWIRADHGNLFVLFEGQAKS